MENVDNFLLDSTRCSPRVVVFPPRPKGLDLMRQVQGPRRYIWPKGLAMLHQRTSSTNVVSPGRRRDEMDYSSYSYRFIQPVAAPSPPSLPLSYELWQQKCERLSARTDYICCACTPHVCEHQSMCGSASGCVVVCVSAHTRWTTIRLITWLIKPCS